MKFRKNSIVAIILLFSFSFLIFGTYSSESEPSSLKETPKVSWEISPILIDGMATGVGANNWTWASSQFWCSGSGTFLDPYVIQNVTINGLDTSSCIKIINSDVYFTISNCTLINSEFDGLILEDVFNGKIVDNNCSFNKGGFDFYKATNCTISRNFLMNNTYEQISLIYCNNNIIQDNTIIGSNAYVSEYGHDNKLIGNLIDNVQYGVILIHNRNDIIENNTILHSTNMGISLDDSNNTLVTNNQIKSFNPDYTKVAQPEMNVIRGIFVGKSSDNVIVGNLIDSFYYGISLTSVHNITISDNDLFMTFRGIFFHEFCYYNIVYQNNIDNKGNRIGTVNSAAISIFNSDFNSIYQNNLYYCRVGIALDYGVNNTIFENDILYYESCFNIHESYFESNKIYDNTCREVSVTIPGYNLMIIILIEFIIVLSIVLKKRINFES